MKTFIIFVNLVKKFQTYIQSISLIKKIIFFYTLIAIPFLYIHEIHLPNSLILILISSTIVISVITLILSIYSLLFLFKKDSRPLYEIGFISVIIALLYFLKFFEHKGGIILIFLVCLFLFLCKLFQSVLYYRITVAGLTILINSLLTFSYIQTSELFLFYNSIKNKYEIENKSLTKWNYNESNRELTYSSIPIKITLAKDFYFHDPKKLNIKQSMGTGQILGVIASSENDPGVYPYLKLLYINKNFLPNEEDLKKEYYSILEFLLNRKDIEELKEIKKPGDYINWDGNFWSFYDNLRPRYSQTGYYVVPLKNRDFLIIDVMENQSNPNFHETGVKEILDSIIY